MILEGLVIMNRKGFIIILIGILATLKNRIVSFLFKKRRISEKEIQMDEKLLG
jgi:hypothetical protein